MGRRHDQLTGADRALLERLARGERPKQIAGAIGITPTGVSQRLRIIERLLGAATPYHAVALYVEKYRKP